MLTDARDVTAALRRAGWTPVEMGAVPVPLSDKVILTAPVAAGEERASWSSARSALAETGRYPVVVYEIDGPESVLHLHPRPMAPEEIIGDSWSVDRSVVIDERYAAPASREEVSYVLRETRRVLGDEPDVDRILAELGPDADLERAERWLLDWELAQPGAVDAAVVHSSGSHSLWKSPDGHGWYPASLYLLPTPEPWHVPAYLDLYGADDRHHLLCAALRSWHARYGAVPRAFLNVQLDVEPARRPVTTDEAWQLARELSDFGGAHNTTLRHLAIRLFEVDVWPLFERP